MPHRQMNSSKHSSRKVQPAQIDLSTWQDLVKCREDLEARLNELANVRGQEADAEREDIKREIAELEAAMPTA